SRAKQAVLSVAPDAAIPNFAELPGGGCQRACPNRAVTRLQKLGNTQVSNFRVPRKPAVLPTDKPFVGTDPKSAVAGDQQTRDIIARELPAGRWRPVDGPHAIEAKQAEFRAQPEVTVGRL